MSFGVLAGNFFTNWTTVVEVPKNTQMIKQKNVLHQKFRHTWLQDV